ncbi:MAG: TonB-dependent receptor [Rhodospirillaceae bacterium]|nr:TonB-dependent receptor [Rhodospirillaceae bacterium]
MKKPTRVFSAVTGAVLALPLSDAHAQVEEIIVTARKRAESLQEIPLAVTAFTFDQIERAGIARIDDIAKLTPSLVFDQAFSAQDTRPTIRGLPASRGRPPIGVLIDGVDVSSEAISTAGGGNLLNLRLIDVERIEVVKGPQSALYGRVAFGGAINYVTRSPGDEFAGRASASVGTHGTYEAVGSVEGPVADTLSLRAYGGYSRSDGYHRDTVSGDRLGGFESIQASMAANLQPSDVFEAKAALSYGKNESEQQAYLQISSADNSSIVVALPSNVAGRRIGNFTIPASIRAPEPGAFQPNRAVRISLNPRTLEKYPGADLETVLGRFHAEYDVGAFTIESTTAYLRADSSVFQDIDGFGARPVQVALPAPGGIGEPLPSTFEFNTDGKTTQFSEDFRLSSLDNEGLRWMVGGLYWREKATQDNRSFAVLLTAPGASAGLNNVLANNPAITSTDETRNTRHYSVYGVLEYDVTGAFTVGVEARQYWEKFVYGFPTSQIALGAGLTPVRTAAGAPGPKGLPLSQDYFAPKVFAEYRVNDDAMVYASIAKGVKPGGISTVGTFNRLSDNIYAPEKLWNYEIGAKTAFLDGRAVFNPAAFYMDYTDKQISTLVVDPTTASGFRGVVSNASGARVYGLELDTTLAVTDQFRTAFAYTYLDAKYTDFNVFTRTPASIAYAGECEIVEIGTGTQSTQCKLDLSGNRLERSPRHAASLTLTYTQPLAGDLELVGEVAAQAQSKRFFDEFNGQWFAGFSNVDVRLTLQSDAWSVTGYVDNLFDDKTIKSGFAQGDFFAFFTSPGSRSNVLLPPDPVRGGVRASYRF